MRDGFLLAMAQPGRDDVEVIIANDEKAPDAAVRLSDRGFPGQD